MNKITGRFCKGAVIIMLLSPFSSRAGDTLKITLNGAEDRLVERNLEAMAQRYNVDALKAREIQAKLFINPTFSAELAVHAENRPWFEWGKNGQQAFNIDQLIELAGKRNKRIQLANKETQSGNYYLYDLLRTLKYDLQENYYGLAYSNQITGQLTAQGKRLEKLIDSFEVQVIKRNVSSKDIVRLKTELINLNSLRNQALQKGFDCMQQLQILLDTTAFIIPTEKTDSIIKPYINKINLLETALENRADLKVLMEQEAWSEINEKFQQSLARPDLLLGAGYDQNGSYAPKFYSIRAAIDLPLFNRNQGGIKEAAAVTNVAKTSAKLKQLEIQTEISRALNKIKQNENDYQAIQNNFEKDFPDINKAVIENFNKGNINLLEFIDFFESYNDALLAINEAKAKLQSSYQELEFVIGTKL